MVHVSRKIACAWKPGFLKSGGCIYVASCNSILEQTHAVYNAVWVVMMIHSYNLLPTCFHTLYQSLLLFQIVFLILINTCTNVSSASTRFNPYFGKQHS